MIGVAYKLPAKALGKLDISKCAPGEYYRITINVELVGENGDKREPGSLECISYTASQEYYRPELGLRPTKQHLAHFMTRKKEFPEFWVRALEKIQSIL